MGIVKFLGFETLGCGCLVGHYRDAGTTSVVTYVEEKAVTCAEASHRRNHALLSRTRASAVGSTASARNRTSTGRTAAAR